MSVRSPLAPLVAALLTFAVPTFAADAPEPRLRHDVVPTLEAVRLHLDADKRSYTGSVRAELQVATPTAHFDLHADGQHLTRVAVLQGGDTLACTTESATNGHLEVTAPRALAAGAAVLEIDFSAQFGTHAVGLYRVMKAGHGYLFTQFEDVDARRAFPCWDEPCFKLPWQLTLELPATHVAISNSPVAHEQVANGWKTVAFERTPPLPSYLVAIATGPFEVVQVAGSHVPLRIVTVQGQKQLAGYAASVAPKLLGALERWFGTPYPFAKLDLVAVPEFAYGAMENAGAITFTDDRLLLDERTATLEQRRQTVGVMCHEMAHMWFGDLVTMRWWDDLWLNESFADWMAAKITDQEYPELQFGLHELEGIQRTKGSDMLPSTIAIRAPVADSRKGLQNVGLVYNKGNAMLAMFERAMGPDAFRRGVRAYLAAHAHGNAVAADLWRALDAAGDGHVSDAMATFTDQPGLPLVRVVLAPGGLELAQSRLTPWGVEQPAEAWRVPVTLRWSSGGRIETRSVMLERATQLVPLSNADAIEWLTANAGGEGYYAWAAPPGLMSRLAREGTTVLTPPERKELLGDLELLLQAGVLHGDTELDALTRFGTDPSPQVVASALAQLGTLRQTLVPDSLHLEFGIAVRRMLSPALERIGLERRAGEDVSIGELRGQLVHWLARWGEDERVDAFARAAAGRWLADSTALEPGLVDAALAALARRGDAALVARLEQRFEASAVPATRRQLLRALGAFDDTTLAARVLDYTMSEHVQPTESLRMWQGFGDETEAHQAFFFHWVLGHYETVRGRMPPPFLPFLPYVASGCSQQRLEAARAFFSAPEHAVPGTDETLERVAADVRECRSLRDREGAAVAEWLQALRGK